MDPPIKVTATQLAAMLGVTNRRVRQLASEGTLERTPQGHFDLATNIQKYVSFRESRREPNEVAQARARHINARATEIELRNAKRIGEIIEMDEAISVVDEVVGSIITALQALPARVTRDLALRRRIEQEIDQIRSAVCDKLKMQQAQLLEETNAARACDARSAIAPADRG